MALKSDEIGFLQGDPVEWNRAVKLWTQIRDELHALRTANTTVAAQAKRTRTNHGGAAPGSIEAMAFKSLIEDSKAAKKAASKQVKVATPKKKASATPSAARAATSAKPKAKPATPAKRGTNGRFLSAKDQEEKAQEAPKSNAADTEKKTTKSADQTATKDQAEPEKKAKKSGPEKQTGEDRDDESDGGKANAPLVDAIKGINDTVGSAVMKAPDIDPTIAAAKELHSIVAPIGRGWSKLFGKNEEKEKKVWYKRIWDTLRGIKDDESAYHQAESRRAGENKHGDKPGVAKSGGILSSLLKLLPGGGKLATLLGGLGRGGGLLRGGLAMGKGLLRRIPLLGALLAGGSAAASVFGPDDPDKTPEENRKARFTGGASGVGALIGGAIGTYFGGPAGALIGGVIGDKVGELVGDWLSTVDWGKVGDQITSAWDETMKWFSAAWKGITSTISPVVDAVKAIVSGIGNWLQSKGLMANTAIKNATGVDVKETAGRAATAATNAAKEGLSVAKKTAGNVVENASDRVAAMAAPIGRVGNSVKDWFLGNTSKAFESGRGGAGTVSTGKGDNGGASYGTYQLSSNAGTLSEFLRSTKYGKEFDGLEPGSPEFNAKWKSIAKSDPTFGDAQHSFMKSTHYDPQMAKLKASGIDLSERGAGVQDAVWSTATQFGGKTSLIEKALKGRDAAKMSDTQIIAAIQDYKVANNETLFKSSSDDVRAGTLKRASAEKDRLIALAGGDSPIVAVASAGVGQSMPTSKVPASQSASVIPPMPAVTSVAAAPSVPDMPSTQTATKVGTSKPQVIQVASNETVGQDVSDRKIAHIATGGLSGSSSSL